MKSLYLIMKTYGRGWGLRHERPHEVFASKKNAKHRCAELNAKAQHYTYEVIRITNGDIKDQ